MSWNEREPPSSDHRVPTTGHPLDDDDFIERLERETDRSLREDPSRWVIASAGEPADEDRRHVSGLKAYTRDAPDPSATARGATLRPRPGSPDFRERARRSAETRRARKEVGAYEKDDRWDA